MRQYSLINLLLLVLLLVFSSFAMADDYLSTVEIQSRHYDNALGVGDAASQGRVSGQIFVDTALLRPGEILETIPGMVVTQHSGDGKANQYFLRGYNLDHGTDFATSVNGVPVNLPTNAHGQGYSDLNFLIPELVESIDYSKGTYLPRNGDFSSAGAADIHYKTSIDRSSLSVTTGQSGYLRTLWIQTPTDSNAQPRWLSAFETLQENGPWTTPEALHKINVLFRLSDGTKTNGWSLDFIGYSAKWNATDQVPLSMIQEGQLGLYSALDPTDGGQTKRLGASLQWRQNDGQSYTKLNAWLQHYELKLWSDFTFYAYRNPVTGCLNEGCVLAPSFKTPTDQFLQFENRNFMGANWAHGWAYSWGQHDAVVEFGAQIRYDNIHVGLANTQDRIPFQLVSDDHVNQTSFGLYLQNVDYWQPWLRTVSGLREDRLNMNLRSQLLAANQGSAAQGLPSSKLSIILGPWSQTEYFFNLGQGFHSNDARGVLNKIDPTTLTPSSPVPALVPSFGKEIGFRSEAIPNLQTSASLWTLHSNSEITFSADSGIGSTSPNGASDRLGLELNNHWTPNKWLLVDADASWIKARYTKMNDNGDVGNQIPNAVSKVFNGRLTFRPSQTWSVGLELRYIGAYPLSQDGSMRAPASTLVNVRYKYQISQNAEMSFDVLNFFNRHYYDIAYQQDYQSSAVSTYNPSGETVHPGEPRQLRGSLKLSF